MTISIDPQSTHSISTKVEEATYTLTHTPGADSVMSFVEAPQFIERFSSLDLGVQVGEEQLPQLHYLLQEAAEILGVETPVLYVKVRLCAMCIRSDINVTPLSPSSSSTLRTTLLAPLTLGVSTA